MTEKRFVFCEGIEDTWETIEEDKYTPCTKDGFQDLCEMLNELHEENEMRKEYQKILEDKIRRLKDRVKTFEKNYSSKDIERYKKMDNCNCITSKRLGE